MTKNLERWHYWMQDFCSSDQFIDWGFYSLIASALQRRIYLGSNDKHLAANMYTILTGPPAAGKGMTIGEVCGILNHPKLLKVANLAERKDEVLAETAEINGTLNNKLLQAGSLDSIKNLLIPMAPNATTFESLVRTLADSSQPMRMILPDGKTKAEFHASVLFVLEELGSLFKKHTEDIHTLLCETYDCKEKYEYKTKHSGHDNIRRPCVNLLAGTTPDFLRRVFSSNILTEGFSSRTVFVVAEGPRFRRYETPVFTSEQKMERENIVDHIKKLTKLQGVCKFSPDALAFNKEWFEQTYANWRPNPHPKLEYYYGRINITHAKLCMAMHFADSLDMTIPLEIAEKALKFLQLTEERMHLALNVTDANPLAQTTKDIQRFIYTSGGTTEKELIVEFYEALPDPIMDIKKILNYLKDSGRIQDDPKGRPNLIVAKRKEAEE